MPAHSQSHSSLLLRKMAARIEAGPGRSQLGWPLPYKLNANKTEEPGKVIAELDQIFYKNVCAEQREKWKGNDVSRHSDQRFHRILHPIDRMPMKLTATHQGAFQQVTQSAPRGRNDFKNDRLFTPDKYSTSFHYSPKEVHVAS